MHIVTHHFKRPLAIVVPSTPLTTSVSNTHSPSSQHTPTPFDELLQRKERALQRRRLGRRIIWDIGVWVLLIPVGGGGFVWIVGRVLNNW